MTYARRVSRQDAFAIVALLVLGVGLPLAVGALADTLAIPRLDDFAYRRIALRLAQTGALVLDVRTMIVGQILLAQPFLWLSGLAPWGFSVLGVTVAAGGVLSAYALARQFLTPARSLLPVVLLLVFPGYLAYATSFMSDVPALALEFACLAMGAAGLRYRPIRDRWLLASIVVGCIGMSIRDFALAAPAAVVLAALCASPRRLRYWAAGIGVVVCYGLLYVLRVALYPKNEAVEYFSGGLFQSLQALAIAALVLSPAVILAAVRWRHRWRRADLLIGAEVGAIIAVLRLVQWYREGTMPLAVLPSMASQWGIPGREMFLGDRPLLIQDTPWAALNVLALAAAILLLAVVTGIVGTYIRRALPIRLGLIGSIGSPAGLVALFCLAVAVGLGLYGLVTPLFDRYYWLLVPPIAILLLRAPVGPAPDASSVHRGEGRSLALAGAPPLVLLCVLALVFQLNSNAFDAALWRAGQTIEQAGVRADEIDAGYAWVGEYASTPATGGGTSAVRYRQIWPDFRQCGWVTSSPAPQTGAELVATQEYNLLLVAGPREPLYLYRSTDPACHSQ